MKPHLAYIKETLLRKKSISDMEDWIPIYNRYRHIAESAKASGFTQNEIIDELVSEKEKIAKDYRDGDELFQKSASSLKTSCFKAIDLLIEELKEGE